MPEPRTLALAGAALPGPPRRSRRDFLRGVAASPQSGDDYWIRVHRQAMACRFEITLASADAWALPVARGALDTIDRLEDRLSIFRDTSIISEVNRCAADRAIDVDEDVYALLELCGSLHRETDGAFDITSMPLSRCWGFLAREGCLPSADAIAAARTLVGLDGVHLDGERRAVRFTRRGVQLNLGAVGKGYALDHVAQQMRAEGVTNGLLSAGRSSLLAIGGGREGWQVEIVSPRASRPLATVWLRDAAIGTTGAGEQFVEVDGVRYGHVIDPRTGWPASGVLSTSVIAPSAAVADALSTAFFVGGRELAERYCAEHPDIVAVMTPDDGSEMPMVVGERSGTRVALTGK